MATVRSKYSPIHLECEVGQPYRNISSGYTCGFHTGIDFPQSRSSRSKSRIVFMQ